MKLDHYLGPRLDGAAERARALEAAGVDGLFTAEAAHGPFLPLALAAEHTERVALITNIAVAFARSPMDLAQIGERPAGAVTWTVRARARHRRSVPHIENRYSMHWSGRPVAQMRELVLADPRRAAVLAGPRAGSSSRASTTRLTADDSRSSIPGPNPVRAATGGMAALGPADVPPRR
jgi:hypothetical protein